MAGLLICKEVPVHLEACCASNFSGDSTMTAQVQLTVVQDNKLGETYSFEEPTQYYVGRAADCDLQFPAAHENKDISRHHCVFSIDPPNVWVHDLGSKNGTFVNDQQISPAEGNDPVELRNGDEVRIGHQMLRVNIEEQAAEAELIASQALAEWIT
jgi:pSer/pThr/pTyr-binding forkhead associated (FHA) protein